MMNSKTLKLGALALAAGLPLAACDSTASAPEAAASGAATAEASESKTLAVLLKEQDDLGTFGQAVETAALGSLFEGPASYTLLAPSDAAFTALGDKGKALMAEDQRALLVAVLRDHMLPGHMTPEAIDKAIADKGGSVTMRTLGEGTVSFAKEGDKIKVTLADGSSALLTGAGVGASNGVIIPLDAVLLPIEQPAA